LEVFIRKNQKTFIIGLFISFSLLISQPGHAWLSDGGAGFKNMVILGKILTENIRRYQQLRAMINQAKNHKQYLKVINSGIVNSIGLLSSLPVKDEKILAELKSFKKSFDTIQDVYGAIPKSKDALLHTLHDQTVAESLRMITSFKDFTKKQNENSTILAIQSRNASPKGAARMQVEASSNILKSLNQLITLNGQMLKMQSEALAMNNKGDKDNVARFKQVNNGFRNGFKDFKLKMKLAKY
jgi:hypothetical protein